MASAAQRARIRKGLDDRIEQLEKENAELRAELDKMRFNRQAELTTLERKLHIKYNNAEGGNT